MQLSEKSLDHVWQFHSISTGISMTYLNPRSAPLNDDITRFTSVDLNSSLQSKYIADQLVCKIISVGSGFKDHIGKPECRINSRWGEGSQDIVVSFTLKHKGDFSIVFPRKSEFLLLTITHISQIFAQNDIRHVPQYTRQLPGSFIISPLLPASDTGKDSSNGPRNHHPA